MKKDYNFKSTLRKSSISYVGESFDGLNKDIFKNASLTHSRFYNCTFQHTNFSRAAVTGSIFERCIFVNCNFDDADFEFCEFRSCEIKYKSIKGCSFNNSNFISSSLSKLRLFSCTFTGTFIEDTLLDTVDLSYSTLEGACFSKCNFQNLNWRNLNLEYVEFIEPKMSNVVLPLHQIPYIFGILQYLSNTKDSVEISNNNENIDIQEFFDFGIPFLISDYEEKELFFPLSNIYMFGKDKDYNKALDYMSREVAGLALVRDYRIIKFCCKLISMSQKFSKKQLNMIYKSIASTDISIKKDSAEMKSYSRNIGEIRSILFRKNDYPNLTIRIKTNIRIEHGLRLANLLHQFQSIAKPNNTDQLYTSFTLSQNSPLIIDIKVEGSIGYFPSILRSFLILTGVSNNELINYPIIKSIGCKLNNDSILDDNQLNMIHKELIRDGVIIALIEYYANYCDEILSNSDTHYYIEDNLYSLTEELV